MFFVTATGTINLPEITADGESACFFTTTAALLTLNPDDSDIIILDGTAAGAAGVDIDNASGAGDFICLISDEIGGADLWYSVGRSGTWVAGT